MVKKLFLTLLLLSNIYSNAYCAASVDGISSGTGNTTVTYAHTVGNANSILIVVTDEEVANSVTGVTYNGTALTLSITNNSTANDTRNWYLLNPDTGTHNIVVSSPDCLRISSVAINVDGLKQQAPEATELSVSTFTTSASDSITTITSNSFLVIGGGSGDNRTFTTVANQTLQAQINNSSSAAAIYTRQATTATAYTTTITTTSSANRLMINSMSFEVASAATGRTRRMFIVQ